MWLLLSATYIRKLYINFINVSWSCELRVIKSIFSLLYYIWLLIENLKMIFLFNFDFDLMLTYRLWHIYVIVSIKQSTFFLVNFYEFYEHYSGTTRERSQIVLVSWIFNLVKLFLNFKLIICITMHMNKVVSILNWKVRIPFMRN